MYIIRNDTLNAAEVIQKININTTQPLNSSEELGAENIHASYYDPNKDGRTFRSLKMSKYKRAFL